MRHPVPIAITLLAFVACGGSQPARAPGGEPDSASAPSEGGESAASSAPAAQPAADADPDQPASQEFAIRDTEGAKDAHGVKPSQIKPTKTEAALKFVVVDKDKGPIPGIVISLTAPDGAKL